MKRDKLKNRDFCGRNFLSDEFRANMNFKTVIMTVMLTFVPYLKSFAPVESFKTNRLLYSGLASHSWRNVAEDGRRDLLNLSMFALELSFFVTN